MPYVEVDGARLWYEEVGSGAPLVCLHSGWGRAVMPFDDAVQVLADKYRLIFPDRRGYGRSTPLEELAIDYHEHAADELGQFVNALEIERPIFWGHSDGAITAALFAARRPDRAAALVLESIHFYRAKSRDFFARFASDPDSLSPHTIDRLRADHGEDRWRTVVAMHSRVWLAFHEVGGDFYGERLEAIRCPVLLVSGVDDPHTPPSEVAELARRLRRVTLVPVPNGGHSPHSEPETARFTSKSVRAFLDDIDIDSPTRRL